MSARSPAKRAPKLVPHTTTTCTCACATHKDAVALDVDVRLIGMKTCPEGLTLYSIAEKYGILPDRISYHRTHHLGLPPLPRGRPRILPEPLPRPVRQAYKPPSLAKPEPNPLPPGREGTFAQLVKTVATLVALGSYRGVQTVRALAARHNVEEAEVLRAHRRATQSVRDARGGLREQLELSVGVLTQIRDQERQVAEDYTGIAERIVASALPDRQTGAVPRRPDGTVRTASQDQLERARTARSVAAQAQDCAVAAQKQIDQNTLHRKTAPIVQVSFSASPDFSRAQDALVLCLDAIVGEGRAERARADVARCLQVLEDAGENLDAPEFLECLAELRGDWAAVEAAVSVEQDPSGSKDLTVTLTGVETPKEVVLAWVDRAPSEGERIRRRMRAVGASRRPELRGPAKALLFALASLQEGEQADLATLAGWCGMGRDATEASLRGLAGQSVVRVETHDGAFTARIELGELSPFQFDPGEDLSS